MYRVFIVVKYFRAITIKCWLTLAVPLVRVTMDCEDDRNVCYLYHFCSRISANSYIQYDEKRMKHLTGLLLQTGSKASNTSSNFSNLDTFDICSFLEMVNC